MDRRLLQLLLITAVTGFLLASAARDDRNSRGRDRPNQRQNGNGNGNGNGGSGNNHNGAGILPGVRARITRKGLDYGAELAIDMLMKNRDSLDIPEFDVTVGGTSIVLSGMVIQELPRPELHITLLPHRSSPIGRLRVDITDLHPVVDANMTISYKSWFLSTSRTGSVTSTARNMTISLQASIGIDGEGRPLPSDVKCNASGDVEFELTGEFKRWSSIVGSIYDTLREHLKPAIFTELCSNILRDVNKTIENNLKVAPMTAVFEEDYEFDYRLTRAPYVTKHFLETSHRGGIYLVERSGDPPFSIPQMPPFQQHTQKMAYVYVTDYVANTGWYSAMKNGDLKLSTGDNSSAMPPAVARLMSTSCPGSVCLGTVFPQLVWLYPDSVAGFDFYASNSSKPVMRLRGRSVRIRCEGIVEFYMSTPRSRDHIITVNVTITGSMDLAIRNNTLQFLITSVNIDSDIRRSSLNLMVSFTELLFDTFMVTASRHVILPALQALGLKGVSLDVPDVPELKFIDPVIVDHNNNGILIVGTDVEYTVPELY